MLGEFVRGCRRLDCTCGAFMLAELRGMFGLWKVDYQRSCMTTSHHILILNVFSDGEMFQLDGSLLRPRAFDRAMAIPIMPPLPNMDVLGLPQTFNMMDITLEIPGDKNNSELRASLACTQMKRWSGLRVPCNLGDVSQYVRAFAYRLHSKAGEILSL